MEQEIRQEFSHLKREIAKANYSLKAIVELLRNSQAEIKHDLSELEKRAMSKLTDWAAQEQADLDGISKQLDAVTTGIDALKKKIDDFQNSPGSLSPTDQKALDDIQKSVADLKSKAEHISTDGAKPSEDQG